MATQTPWRQPGERTTSMSFTWAEARILHEAMTDYSEQTLPGDTEAIAENLRERFAAARKRLY